MLPSLREELAERYGHDGLGEWDESDDALLVDASRAKAAYYADKSPDLDPARLRARRRSGSSGSGGRPRSKRCWSGRGR